jgi:hypothetical protein
MGAQANPPGVYRRAMSYFTPDWPGIAVLVVLIGASVTVGLLEAWPLAILIDSVLTQDPKGGWLHRYFLAVLPDDKTGQLVGLVLYRPYTPSRRLYRLAAADDAELSPELSRDESRPT